MTDRSPQLENGYTKIADELLEALARTRIPGEAMQMLNVIIRKTYGFNKRTDHIATTQFVALTGLSRRGVQRARNKLLEMNIIRVTKKGYTSVLMYSVQKNYKIWVVTPKKVTLTNNGAPCNQKRLPSVTNNRAHKRDSTTETYTREIRDIVECLNQRLGTHYKPNSQKTGVCINARLNEGFTVENFKHVIDIKAIEWGNDPNMSKYLRPETLFGTKFEGYLNQLSNEPQGKSKGGSIKDRYEKALEKDRLEKEAKSDQS